MKPFCKREINVVDSEVAKGVAFEGMPGALYGRSLFTESPFRSEPARASTGSRESSRIALETSKP